MINLPKRSYRYYLSQIPTPIRTATKNWGATVGAIFLIVFFVIFAIKPTVITIAELLAEIKAREELNQELEIKIDQIFAAQVLYNQIYDRLYLVDQALPANPEFAYFSQNFEANRLNADLGLSTLNYSSITLTQKETRQNTDENQEFNFATGLTGYYPNLKTLLENVFNQRRIIYIDNIQIDQGKTSQTDEESLSLIITVNGKAFYLGNE